MIVRRYNRVHLRKDTLIIRKVLQESVERRPDCHSIWSLKDKNKQFEIAWEIAKKCVPYKSSSRRCDCLTEKLYIVQGDAKNTLNERSEIANKCRHSNKFSYSAFLKQKRISKILTYFNNIVVLCPLT